MGAASFVQTSFLGGEWSKRMQGRTDHPMYKAALNLCLNAIPTEEGAFVRRPGTRFICTTRDGAAGRVMPLQLTDETSYAMEFTSGHMRMLNGPGLVFNNDNVSVTAISTATPAVMTIGSARTWATGTEIQFFFDSATRNKYPDVCAILKNRQFKLTRLSSTTYSLADPVSGSSLVGTSVNFSGASVATSATSILDVVTPWTGTTWDVLRSVQNQDETVLLDATSAPYTMTFTAQAGVTNVGTAVLAAANMLDGPYLDEDVSGAWVTAIVIDATIPSIIGIHINFPLWDTKQSYNRGQFVYTTGPDAAWISLVDNNIGHDPATPSPTYWAASSGDAINGPNGLSSYDIGRCFRFKTEPALWSANTTYALNDLVTYNGNYFVSMVASNANNQPDLALEAWQPTTSEGVAFWTWGRIISTYNMASATGWFHIEVIGPQIPTLNYTPARISHFRFGVYGDTLGGGKGWPTCGVFHQGRLWLSGAVPNRVDASKSNQYFNFEPTLKDGTVADDNGISEIFNADEMNQIYWMAAIGQGILCGTKGGEWLVQASALNDPITPTSIQAHEVTHYGCANIPPVKTGLALVFVQKAKRKVMEYLSDVFSGKFSAPNLTEAARHLTADLVEELAYQEEQSPIVWARTGDVTTLAGITYRRVSSFVSEAPSFAAWHRTVLGGSKQFESICVVLSLDGTTETLTAVVNDTVAACRHVVQLTDVLDESATQYETWHLDDAVACTSLVTTSGGVSGLQIYGLTHLNTQVVDVWAMGLDLGHYTVASGTIFVPFGADTGGLFTLAAAQAFSASGTDMGIAVGTFSAGSGATAYNIPILVGHTYTTQGQCLRPGTQQEAGSMNGPPLGKTSRAHMFSVLLDKTISGSVKFGTTTANARTTKFTTGGGTAYSALTPFSGVFQNTLDDDYNFDTMLYWEVTRPYPLALLAIGANLHTQDR